MALLVRAINYAVGLQKFTIVYLTRLEEIGPIHSGLRADDGSTLQTGVCAVTAGNWNVILCDARMLISILEISEVFSKSQRRVSSMTVPLDW